MAAQPKAGIGWFGSAIGGATRSHGRRRRSWSAAISSISRMRDPRAAERMRGANLVMLGQKGQIADHATAFFKACPRYSHDERISKGPLRRRRQVERLAYAMRQTLVTT